MEEAIIALFVFGGAAILYLVFTLIPRQRRDKQLRAEFEASPLEERIARAVSEATGQWLTWRRSSSGKFTLHSGTDLLAKLFISPLKENGDELGLFEGKLIGAETVEGKWRVNPMNPPTLRLDQEGGVSAALEKDIWFGNDKIRFNSGRVFEWKKQGRRARWALVDDNEAPHLYFENESVAIDQKSASLSELPAMVLMGSYLMLLKRGA